MKKISAIALTVAAALTLASCSEAEVVSENVSKAADSFEVPRRIIFFNGITDTYLLTVEGYCSIEADVGEYGDSQLEVTCKVGPKQYKKHFLGLSDNVSYFVEQTEPVEADPYRYRVIFRPETIVPDIDVQVG